MRSSVVFVLFFWWWVNAHPKYIKNIEIWQSWSVTRLLICRLHSYQILNLPLILSNFECLYLARWFKVGWVWGAKLLYRPPTKSTSSFKPLISPDQPEMVKSLWRVIQILINVRVWKSLEKGDIVHRNISTWLKNIAGCLPVRNRTISLTHINRLSLGTNFLVPAIVQRGITCLHIF